MRRRWGHRVVADETVFDVGVDVVLVAKVGAAVLLRPARLAIAVRGLLASQRRLAILGLGGLPRLRLLHQAGIQHLALARLEAGDIDERTQLPEQRLHALRAQTLAKAPDRRVVGRVLRQVDAQKALEREPVGNRVLDLLVRQRVQLAQHQHLEHAHRVVPWGLPLVVRRTAALARVTAFVAHRFQRRAEDRPGHDGVQRHQRIALRHRRQGKAPHTAKGKVVASWQVV